MLFRKTLVSRNTFFILVLFCFVLVASQEICELVAEGYQALQTEIQRKHKENQDLKKKLILIESIVVRGVRAGIEPATEGRAGIEPATEDAQQPENDRGHTTACWRRRSGAEGGGKHEAWDLLFPPKYLRSGAVKLNFVAEHLLPDVVLIKDEDSDSNHSSEEDGKTSSSRDLVSRSVKRLWPGGEDADRKSSSEPPKPAKKNFPVYLVDSLEAGESLGSFSSHTDPNRPSFFSLTESPSGSPRTTLQMTDSPSSPRTLPALPSVPSEREPGRRRRLRAEDGQRQRLVFEREQRLCFSGAEGGKRLFCPVCSKTYATSQNLEVHMRIHTGERPFRCAHCGKKFTQSAHLKAHEHVHSGERPYTCTLCPRSFIVKYSLKLHMDRCHASGGEQNVMST
ncbi:hypothetical protein KUCAC02_025010 [Chaenocephalus aceratus]|nr:hypothetical protein KUCAC02_025010 [Chaenocephalus aceratus]